MSSYSKSAGESSSSSSSITTSNMDCIRRTIKELFPGSSGQSNETVGSPRSKKPLGKVWNYFKFHPKDVSNDDSIDYYECTFCNISYKHKHATRFASHLLDSCKNCPQDVKKLLPVYGTGGTEKRKKSRKRGRPKKDRNSRNQVYHNFSMDIDGKPKGKVWDYFKFQPKDISNAESIDYYECKFCNVSYTHKHATRFANHLLRSCKNCPKDVKNLLSVHGTGGTEESRKSRKRSKQDCNQTYYCSMDIDENTNNSTSISLSCLDSAGQSPNNEKQCLPTAQNLSTLASEGTLASSTKAPNKRGDIPAFAKGISRRKQGIMNELLARAIFTSGVGFMTVPDNKYWLEFFKRLNPSYKVPDRHTIATELLDNEHERVLQKVHENLQSSDNLCLQLDGWTNRRGKVVVNFIVTTPFPLFYRTVITKKEEHTSEYLATLIEDVLLEIGVEKFQGIVTDSVSTMVKAVAIVCQKYKHITSYTCAAHSLNLFVQDVLKIESIADLTSKCRDIVKNVNNSLFLSSFINEKQIQTNGNTLALKLPVVTRWTSWSTCLKSLLDTQMALKLFCVEGNTESLVEPDIEMCILDDNFWIRVRFIYDLIKPAVDWIAILESTSRRLSSVPEAYIEISKSVISNLNSNAVPLNINEQEKMKIEAILSSRVTKALQPIHFAANILDPKYRGKNLKVDDEIRGMELIELKTNEMFSEEDQLSVMGELAEYKCEDGFYGHSFVQKSALKVDPLSWWKGTCTSSALGKIAQRLLSLPATTAAFERPSSVQENIRIAKRDWLTAETADKVTFIHYNLKLHDQKKNQGKPLVRFQAEVQCQQYGNTREGPGDTNPDIEDLVEYDLPDFTDMTDSNHSYNNLIQVEEEEEVEINLDPQIYD